jgi:diguanylate cyclase (GGDEF)-like protein/PAS domain S-box-containing protein
MSREHEVPGGRRPEELLSFCVAAADTPITIADALDADHPLIYVNPAFVAMTGYSGEDVLGRNARFLQGPATDPAAVRAMGGGLRSGRFTRVRLLNYRADGSAFWNDVHISVARDDSGVVTHFMGVQHDVTADVEAQAHAARVMTRDPLTGLLNRAAFDDELHRVLERAAATGTAAAVLFLDIDAFKAVNDAHGHLVGDVYLAHAASTLRTRLRGRDVVGRRGGDEFVALLADLPEDTGHAVDRVVADLDAALREPFTVDGTVHRMTLSIGAAVFPRDGTAARDLVRHADAEMYRRKRARAGPGA